MRGIRVLLCTITLARMRFVERRLPCKAISRLLHLHQTAPPTYPTSVQSHQLPFTSAPDNTSTYPAPLFEAARCLLHLRWTAPRHTPASVRGHQTPSASAPDATMESIRDSQPKMTLDLTLPNPQKRHAKRQSAPESTAPSDTKESSPTGTPCAALEPRLALEPPAAIQIRDVAVHPFILRAHNPTTTWDLERFVHGRCHLSTSHM